jgi:hypothetical protein
MPTARPGPNNWDRIGYLIERLEQHVADLKAACGYNPTTPAG